MADPKWKKGKYKRARSVCSSSSSDYSFTGDCGNESKRFKQVSTWTIDDLEKLGIRYDSEESPLSELLSKVRCKTERHVNQKPVPTFISCLDHYTRKSLKFSLADDIADYESAQDELIKVNSKLAEVNLAIEKIREEDSELIDHDRINRILFETWSSRVRDFMLAYQRFIEEQIFKPYRTKTTYVQLFSKFTGIFLLNPEPGDKRTVFFGEETVASVPDICFILHAVNSHFRVFWTITLTEEQRSESKVKDTGLKRKNSKDSEEKFDLRESLPKNLLAQHGGQLVVEREKTALRPCVLGTICAATEGAVPSKKPQKRKLVSEESASIDKKEKSKKYEANRECVFKEIWKNGREWLEFDWNEGVMKCGVCTAYYAKLNKPTKGKNTFMSK